MNKIAGFLWPEEWLKWGRLKSFQARYLKRPVEWWFVSCSGSSPQRQVVDTIEKLWFGKTKEYLCSGKKHPLIYSSNDILCQTVWRSFCGICKQNLTVLLGVSRWTILLQLRWSRIRAFAAHAGPWLLQTFWTHIDTWSLMIQIFTQHQEDES